jgi:thiol-disulfide isomerase/thioredoxin
MNKNLLIIAGASILILSTVFSIYKKDKVEISDSNMKKDETIMVKKDITIISDTEMLDKKEMEKKEETMMIKKGSYEIYSENKLQNAIDGKVIIFFYAPWCPTCQGLDKDIKANLNNIPEKVSILNLDYDSSSVLKKKYGVTYQHTLVQVDKDGNLIKKWSGGSTLKTILDNIQ